MRHGVGVEGELSDLHLLLPVDARSIKYLLYVYVLFIEQMLMLTFYVLGLATCIHTYVLLHT